MPFDLATAKPAGQARGGFQISSARPVNDPSQPATSSPLSRSSPAFSPYGYYTPEVQRAVGNTGQIGEAIEPIAQVGSGLVSSAVAGIAGVGNALWNISPAGMLAHKLGLPEIQSGNLVRDIQEAGTYQPRSQGGQQVSAALASNKNPMNWPSAAGEFLGDKAEAVGAPPLISAGLKTAPDALAAMLGIKGVRAAGAPELIPSRMPANLPGVPQLSATGAPRVLPKASPDVAPATPRELTASGTPRAAAYTDLEGAAKKNAPPKFVEETPIAHEGRQLPPEQQATREQILERVGIPEVRNSAIAGDAKAAATDFQMSRLDSDEGQHMTRVLTGEREALGTYAEQLAQDTGGTRGLGQTETLQRGQNIVAPLDSLKQFFDDRIASLYRTADMRAEGRPFELAETKKIIGDESEFLGTTDGEALLKGARSRMRNLGLIDAEGAALPATVQAAERFKQWLGDKWTPRTSRLIRRLKESIDDDVMKAAGEDIYKSARALRAERARILDDPKGISKIMDAEGPEGINRSVAVEKIPDTLTTLPVAQFEHIVKVLNDAPAEIRPQAQAALAEIKSQFANKVQEIGSKQATQWNAKGVSKYLNDNAARMKAVFSKEELKKFADLNDAGHILRFDSSYPGASVQATNLLRAKVVEGGLAAVGGAAGSVLGPVGAAVGTYGLQKIGARLSRGMNERSALAAAKARTKTLTRKTGTQDLGDADVAELLEGDRR